MSATKLLIDTKAIEYNLRQIKKALPEGTTIMPMVKANAYGCGVEIVSEVIKDYSFAAVADANEALYLKQFYYNSIILIYQPAAEEIPIIVENEFIPGCCDYGFICRLNEAAEKVGKLIKIHLSVDTGAGRLGISLEECDEMAQKLKELKNIHVHGVFTHYASSDSLNKEDLRYTQGQTKKFEKAVNLLESVLGRIDFRHASCSCAIFTQNSEILNMARPGYMLYGYYPSPDFSSFVDLKPSATLVTKVLYVKKASKGSSIGYNRTYTLEKDSLIATIGAGYSDGIQRHLSNKGFVVINEQRAPIVGRVCMDITMIDVTNIKGNVSAGDAAAIFDNNIVTLDDIAKWCDTIGYEILVQIPKERVDRVRIIS